MFKMERTHEGNINFNVGNQTIVTESFVKIFSNMTWDNGKSLTAGIADKAIFI